MFVFRVVGFCFGIMVSLNLGYAVEVLVMIVDDLSVVQG